jgi:hypothetical protein
MKNTKGFAVLEGLLILVIVGILGFTGWYVLQARNKANKNLADANAANSSTTIYSHQSTTTTTETKDQYAGWKTCSSRLVGLSIKYPESWLVSCQTSPNTDRCIQDAGYISLSPSDKETKDAAVALGSSSLQSYTIDLLKYGTQSSKCAHDGNDFSNVNCQTFQDGGQLNSGTFKGSWLSLWDSTSSNGSMSEFDAGVVFSKNCTGSNKLLGDPGTLSYSGKTYQISISSDGAQHEQYGDSALLNTQRFKLSDMYKNTIKILNSINVN